MKSARQQLLQVYRAALAAVQGAVCTQHALGEHRFNGPLTVVAIGKAAASMMQGAQAALGKRFAAGLLISKHGHCDEDLCRHPAIHCLSAGHPLPDAHSLQAGRALLQFLQAQPAQRELLFLISGGTSALVEVLPEGMGLEDLQRVNGWLLGSGWDIAAMNTLRKSFSCIKGGRLACMLAGRPALNLLISDVPDNAPWHIGSGLLVPFPKAEVPTANMPAWMRVLPKAPAAPLADAPCFASIQTRVIATLDDALLAAEKEASTLGYVVHRHGELLRGDAQQAAEHLAREVCDGPPGLYLWGGETTVKLPPEPGQGGRNQHLALAAAQVLAGREGIYLLAAGTDGSDGPTTAAGALVDGGTLRRGVQAGEDAQACLAAADSGRFLQASGDLIHTGPTGTNVMDLLLALKLAPA